MFDIDTLHQIKAEDMQVRKWENSERNRILRMTNPKRKQEEWNKLFPKFAIEGLSEEDLNIPW